MSAEAEVYDLFLDMAAEATRPELAWMDYALCAEVATDLWFPEKGEPSADAKRVCMACEVRIQCRDYAVDEGIQHGIWGGTSSKQRAALRRNKESEAA